MDIHTTSSNWITFTPAHIVTRLTLDPRPENKLDGSTLSDMHWKPMAGDIHMSHFQRRDVMVWEKAKIN